MTEEETRTMSIIHHLEELRKRLLICLLVLVVTAGASFFYVDEIRRLLVKPAGSLELIYISPPEALMVNIRLAILAGIMLAMPVFVYQFLAFILPALYKNEKHILIPVVFGMILMFIAGIYFSYSIAFPFAITFFLKFASTDLVPMFTITQYTSFVTQFLLTFGLVFQLPLLFLFLGMINVVTAPMLRRIRKYVILVIFIGAAIITPPDVVSQIMIAGPLWVLYEVGIVLVMVVQFRRRRKKSE
jgi:sec-independent protein translocase protein TatC